MLCLKKTKILLLALVMMVGCKTGYMSDLRQKAMDSCAERDKFLRMELAKGTASKR